MSSSPQPAAAIRFIDCFPEAEVFNVLILTEDKQRPIVNEPKCTRHKLLVQLPNWLKLQHVHFFIRPLVGNLVMVDLDNYSGDLETVMRLKPRALASTSPGNYQAWLMIPASLATKTALWVTKQLTEVLHGDKNSAKDSQHGRMPGKRFLIMGDTSGTHCCSTTRLTSNNLGLFLGPRAREIENSSRHCESRPE
jgi:hypothetical protein